MSLSGNELDADNIPLCVEVDFNRHYVQSTFKMDGLWSDQTERVGKIPFVKGENFELKIVLSINVFKVRKCLGCKKYELAYSNSF